MPKKGLTEIICIIDKSGSMGGIASDAIGGFNTFLQNQRAEEGEARMSVVLFDTTQQIVCMSEDVNKVKELDRSTYVPNGMTALYDAVGMTLTQAETIYARTVDDQRPEKVIIAILTDGEENSSRHYKRAAIFNLISKQTERGWQFIYLGANQDAFSVAESIGISKEDAMNFEADAAGIKEAWCKLSVSASAFRKFGK